VTYVSIAGRWAFQFTALDDCTRFRVLRLYRRLHHSSSLAFLAELRRAFPFPIQRLQCDHGQECSFAFVLGVEAAGIRHRYIRPRRPQQNGKVERRHRIDNEEFWRRHRFQDFEVTAAALRAWETRYNYERFSLALQGRTPAEKLAAFHPPRLVA
jgi:transposase InsO family protein